MTRGSQGEDTTAGFVSVVVPAYNVGQTVDACLRSLQAQAYAKDKYEIIVVDNGSTDDTEARVRRHHVKYISVRGRSVYSARNRAVEAAKGDVLAFTDSDCVLGAGWIEAGVSGLREYDIVAGRIEPMASERKWLYAYDKFVLRPATYRGEQINGTTMNMFVRRSVFRELDGFLEGVSTAGDSLFCLLARERGRTVGYVASAVVYHPVESLWRRFRRVFREGHGSKLKRSYLYHGRSAMSVAKIRCANAMRHIKTDLGLLKEAKVRGDIDVITMLGVGTLAIVLFAMNYIGAAGARLFGKLTDRLACR